MSRLTTMAETIAEAMAEAEDHLVGQIRLAIREIDDAKKSREVAILAAEEAYEERVGKSLRILQGIVTDFDRETAKG